MPTPTQPGNMPWQTVTGSGNRTGGAYRGDTGYQQGGGNLNPFTNPYAGTLQPVDLFPGYTPPAYPPPTQVPVNFVGTTGVNRPQLPANQWLGAPPFPPPPQDTGFTQGGGNLRPPMGGTPPGGGYGPPSQIPVNRSQQMPGWAGYLQWLNQQRLTPRWGPIPGINGWA